MVAGTADPFDPGASGESVPWPAGLLRRQAQRAMVSSASCGYRRAPQPCEDGADAHRGPTGWLAQPMRALVLPAARAQPAHHWPRQAPTEASPAAPHRRQHHGQRSGDQGGVGAHHGAPTKRLLDLPAHGLRSAPCGSQQRATCATTVSQLRPPKGHRPPRPVRARGPGGKRDR